MIAVYALRANFRIEHVPWESFYLQLSQHRIPVKMDVRWTYVLMAMYIFAMQIVVILLLFNAKAVINSPQCFVTNSSHKDAPVHQAQSSSSLWYYEHEHEFQPAKLRVLTAKDGAEPLLSRIPPRDREITIVTGMTRDRMDSVEQTAMTWGGALCMAVHVIDEEDIPGLYHNLKDLHARVEARGSCRLNIQLVKEDGPKERIQKLYPVNGLRNIAWRMATTILIFLLDVDFRPSQGMHESLTTNEAAYEEMVKKATEKRHIFVVAAFEEVRSDLLISSNNSNGNSHPLVVDVGIPTTKEDLRRGWVNYTFDCFRCQKAPASHEPTNFRKFFDPATTSPYLIPYREAFEPYLIVARESAPMYDERFRGYGKNKISQVYDCIYGSHMRLHVLPGVFIFEMPHTPSQSRRTWDKNHVQMLQVEGLYRRFKSEVDKRRMAW